MKVTRMQWMMGMLAALRAQEKNLTADELQKLVENEKNLFFLDVREPKEIEELGTIRGYVNIPVGELEKRLAEIPKDKLIVTA